MKEYIERAAVKDEIISWAVCINHPELLSKEDTMYCIDNLPAADVVEVVRCKNCRYYPTTKVNEKGFLICPASSMEITEADYCSYGERMDKEDEHEQ